MSISVHSGGVESQRSLDQRLVQGCRLHRKNNICLRELEVGSVLILLCAVLNEKCDFIVKEDGEDDEKKKTGKNSQLAFSVYQ